MSQHPHWRPNNEGRYAGNSYRDRKIGRPVRLYSELIGVSGRRWWIGRRIGREVDGFCSKGVGGGGFDAAVGVHPGDGVFDGGFEGGVVLYSGMSRWIFWLE